MFIKAKPVYLQGKSRELNTFAAFRAVCGSLRGMKLHIAAYSFYQLYVNGQFVAFGPARTAKGYAREDVLELDAFGGAENEILIVVSGYGCYSMSAVDQPSFVQAEVRRGDEAVCWTGAHFEGYLSLRRRQKVQRYSVQRQFSEVWDFDRPLLGERMELEVIEPAPEIIARVAPYPVYRDEKVEKVCATGILSFDETLPYKEQKYSHPLAESRGYFAQEDIPSRPFVWIQRQAQHKRQGEQPLPVVLHAGEYAIVDFGRIEAGFFTWKALAEEQSDLIVAFSEISTPDAFHFTAMNAHNAIEWFLPAGEAEGMSFEPYTARYVLAAVREGSVRLDAFGIKTYEAAVPQAPVTGDDVLDAVARGAVRTYAHNAVDLYMDCPSRERAGWLCDSYFTARTEQFLLGEAPVEQAFLENYRLYVNDGSYPEGALPMCYPSDPQYNGKFIPQWTMWYVLEVAERLRERAPGEDRELYRASVEGLLAFYQRYENEDGLLEKLPSWNFVEWSRANQWTQDVNYPTNFLYAQTLEAAGEILGREDLRAKAEGVRKTAVQQSFDGRLFLDHAVRDENGCLVRQADCSEICQYYAILFGGIDTAEPRYAELYRLITQVFAAQRRQPMPEVEEINAFIGVYLRLDALLKLGEKELVLRDIREFFGKMEQQTGTLWEYRETERGSKDHGFASYALPAMMKALN